jgi:hypothetical protein
MHFRERDSRLGYDLEVFYEPGNWRNSALEGLCCFGSLKQAEGVVWIDGFKTHLSSEDL